MRNVENAGQQLHGHLITPPSDSRCAPSTEFLRWHNDQVFRA
jgi:hypothetical protein